MQISNEVITSFMDEAELDLDQKQTKMSKSKGNVTTVDMSMYGIVELDQKYELRDVNNIPIKKWNKFGVWRDIFTTGMFYAGASFNEINKQMFGDRFKNLPVFLCKKGEEIPPRFKFNGKEIMQHSKLYEFWDKLYEKYPDEFYDVKPHQNDYLRAGIYCQDAN